ncbi:MAG: type III-B CRISPR-associated protein Cas10/Cmr2 [Kiritimatiellaeota bacterium]|nr:type III-B CRISPR-associated protein Cas10/Cmr2 [Kiritimatiellota bacterium]
MSDLLARTDADFWKRKLAAFLHDPPHKPLDFGPAHEKDAFQILKAALPGVALEQASGLVANVKSSDWTAAAADRFCFRSGKAPSKFTGEPGATFRHPLGAAEYEIEKLPTPGLALEWLQHAFGGIKPDENAPEAEQWRQRFFLYWRRWLEQTVLQNPAARNLAFYPADTRIPDHTIWNHMNLASALEACRGQGDIGPAFLVFQLGPVQDFIAAARSTRDLWSGSYLLALLTAHAIKAVTDRLGPDNIIFPALRGQGVFDVLHQEEIYSRISYKAGDDGRENTLWERMYGSTAESALKRLLNPTLPNRFVALVPENHGETLGTAAEKAVHEALEKIAEKCFERFARLAAKTGASEALTRDMHARWDAQVDAFPKITWVATPWLHDIETAIADFANLPVNKAPDEDAWTPRRILEKNLEIARKVGLPPDNVGFLWMLNYHRAEFALAARRNTRDFAQFKTDAGQAGTPKDALTGKEEIIGDEKFWANPPEPFKQNEGPYGAITIIKRLWCRSETGLLPDLLQQRIRATRAAMSVESVADIAAGNEAGAFPEPDENGDRKPRNPYVAILALDGDEMGKWISGAKTPKLLDQVSEIARKYLERIGVSKELPRALTPSYHMQFSEALANFATYLAGPIVEKYKGQLIYAGGDDVLAMLPADSAIDCARALRAAFRGRADELPEEQRNYELASTQNGFLLVDKEYPLIVPGPAAEVSVGIAIAHYQHPLQAIVREAQAAEKRAKRDVDKGGHGRAAFAVSLMKRGGETIHWGANWDSGALELLDSYRGLRKAGKLSARFPYNLAALLMPYRLHDGEFDKAPDIILAELEHVMEQQGQWEGDDPEKNKFRKECASYLNNLEDKRLADFANLFLTVAFMDRDRSDAKQNEKGGEDV